MGARKRAREGRRRTVVSTVGLDDRRFERILAVRVGHFHREPAAARRLAERWLAPGGVLLTAFDPPA